MSIGRFMKIESSSTCSKCGVKTNTYRRYFHQEMLQFLRLLAKTPGWWATTRTILGRSGPKASSDGAYLIHWGLVEKRGRGVYRITDKGLAFLQGKAKAASYIRMRNGALLSFSRTRVDVEDLSND